MVTLFGIEATDLEQPRDAGGDFLLHDRSGFGNI